MSYHLHTSKSSYPISLDLLTPEGIKQLFIEALKVKDFELLGEITKTNYKLYPSYYKDVQDGQDAANRLSLVLDKEDNAQRLMDIYEKFKVPKLMPPMLEATSVERMLALAKEGYIDIYDKIIQAQALSNYKAPRGYFSSPNPLQILTEAKRSLDDWLKVNVRPSLNVTFFRQEAPSLDKALLNMKALLIYADQIHLLENQKIQIYLKVSANTLGELAFLGGPDREQVQVHMDRYLAKNGYSHNPGQTTFQLSHTWHGKYNQKPISVTFVHSFGSTGRRQENKVREDLLKALGKSGGPRPQGTPTAFGAQSPYVSSRVSSLVRQKPLDTKPYTFNLQSLIPSCDHPEDKGAWKKVVGGEAFTCQECHLANVVFRPSTDETELKMRELLTS